MSGFAFGSRCCTKRRAAKTRMLVIDVFVKFRRGRMSTEQRAQSQAWSNGCKLVDQVQNNRAILRSGDRLRAVLKTFKQLSQDMRDRETVFCGL